MKCNQNLKIKGTVQLFIKKTIKELHSVTCRMVSHSVTYHPNR